MGGVNGAWRRCRQRLRRRQVVQGILHHEFPVQAQEAMRAHVVSLGLPVTAANATWAGLRESALLAYAQPKQVSMACPSGLVLHAWLLFQAHPVAYRAFAMRILRAETFPAWLPPEDPHGRWTTLRAWQKLRKWGCEHLYGTDHPLLFNLDQRYGYTPDPWWQPGQPLTPPGSYTASRLAYQSR